jgi:hypothetical protein
MDASDSYIVVESMLLRGEIRLSDLKPLLDSLEGQGQISHAEHESLLELAKRLNLNDTSSV